MLIACASSGRVPEMVTHLKNPPLSAGCSNMNQGGQGIWRRQIGTTLSSHQSLTNENGEWQTQNLWQTQIKCLLTNETFRLCVKHLFLHKLLQHP